MQGSFITRGNFSQALVDEAQVLDELEQIRERRMRELKNQMSTPKIEKPIEVSDRNFDQTVKNYPLIVVDCWAAWCAPCRAIAPIVEELAKEYSGKVVFGKLNVDENPETAQRYGVMAIPTLLVMKEGKEVDRVVGVLPKNQLEAKVNAYA
ncbi:MAG: thioredoxin [Candidatus Bathyarchaeia archaeon]